jgi:hypothetical protein
MPRLSTKITVDARISVTPQYLRHSRAPELLQGKYDFSPPGLRLKGVVIAANVGPNGKLMCEVRLDDLPDCCI